jgi:hypothetical protein
VPRQGRVDLCKLEVEAMGRSCTESFRDAPLGTLLNDVPADPDHRLFVAVPQSPSAEKTVLLALLYVQAWVNPSTQTGRRESRDSGSLPT